MRVDTFMHWQRCVPSIGRFALLVALATGAGPRLYAQEQSENVFRAVSDSVFLVEMVRPNGEAASTGSAVLIAPNELLTNAHVVADGRCTLRIGAVRVSCTVAQAGSVVDLALLTVDEELLARPLPIAASRPGNGETVFAVSNPLGLERTISHGLFSGTRRLQGEPFVQFSAPVSPGSSGGALVNRDAELVGIVVASLNQGQLVNLAVGRDEIVAFLGAGNAIASVLELRDRLRSLAAVGGTLQWSREPSSAYQENRRAKVDLLRSHWKLATTGEDLLALASEARYLDNTLALEIARQAHRVEPSGNASLLMAGVLHDAASSPDVAVTERAATLASALKYAQEAQKTFGRHEPTLMLQSYIYRNLGRLSAAYAAAEIASESPGGPSEGALSALIGLAAELKREEDATRWLEILQERGSRLSLHLAGLELKDGGFLLLAARAFDASGAKGDGSSWCDAAEMWWRSDEDDESLASARACIKNQKPSETNRSKLSYTHRLMGWILLGRGLAAEALASARSAVDLGPDDGYAYHLLASALLRDDRKMEAIEASKVALRLTDGKHSSMHFALGSAYFGLERWKDAALAFESAARLDPTDAAAAFNVAVSNSNDRDTPAAIFWAREALRRSPPPETKLRAEQLLRRLGQQP